MLLNMSLILKTVNNNNISVGFNLQYRANEGIKHLFNLSFNQMRVRLYFWQTNEFTIKIKTWKK